jgi:hypothetical protein
MIEEIKKAIPDGYKITSFINDISNGKITGKITITIEKIDIIEFENYWEKYSNNGFSHILTEKWQMYGWHILIDFYRWFAKELNGDWEPDWKSESQGKYYIIYNHSSSGGYEANKEFFYSYSGIVFSGDAVEKALQILPTEFLDKLFQI